MTNQHKYTTVEGHPIVKGGWYETRDGRKVLIVQIGRSIPKGISLKPVVGAVMGDVLTHGWTKDGYYTREGTDLDLMRPTTPYAAEQPEPERKRYEFSEMWAVWRKRGKQGDHFIQKMNCFFTSLEQAQGYAKGIVTAIAITRADATEFTEGEGLIENQTASQNLKNFKQPGKHSPRLPKPPIATTEFIEDYLPHNYHGNF